MTQAQSPDDGTTPVKRKPGRPRKDVAIEQDARKETFKREPFGGRRLKLAVSGKDPAYHYGWFRDQGDNLIRLRRAGYVPVSFREAEREVPEAIENTDDRLRPEDACRTHGGLGEGNIPYNMILMKQPIEFYDEDRKVKQQANEAIDTAVLRPEFKDGSVVDNQYGDINVSVRDKE